MPDSSESDFFTDSLRSGSDFWAYTRRVRARSEKRAVLDLTLRSRTWAGMEHKVQQVLNHTPTDDINVCEHHGEISYGFGGASVNMPIDGCDVIKPVWNVNHSRKEFGADYDGVNGKKGAQIGASAILKTPQGVQPVFADYTWIQLGATFWKSGIKKRHADSGW